jgi:hypothetical protein
MALNHFKAKHFKAKHYTTLGSLLGEVVAVVTEWLLRARRRLRR